MKKLYFLFFMILFLSKNYAQEKDSKKFVIEGKFKNLNDTIVKVILTYTNGENTIKDTAIVKGNLFSFEGEIDEPADALLTAVYQLNKKNITRKIDGITEGVFFSLEPSLITIICKDYFTNITIEGSKSEQEFERLLTLARPYNHKSADLFHQIALAKSSNDTISERKIRTAMRLVRDEMLDSVYLKFVIQNPASIIAPNVIQQYAANGGEFEKIAQLFALLPEGLKNTYTGRKIQMKINAIKTISVGTVFPDMPFKDINNKSVYLNKFNKWTLIHFWASWCVPCRKEYPELLNVINQYKTKGLEVVLFSIDRKKAEWKAAIKAENLSSFRNVCDAEVPNGYYSDLLNIHSVPQNMLIDDKGVIVATNIDLKEVQYMLAKIFDNKNQ